MSETYQGNLALASCMLGLSTISIALRFYSRRKQKAPIKTDDWLMIPTLILLAGTVGCTFYGVHKKLFGYPTSKDPLVVESLAPTSSKLLIASDLFSITTLGCTKLSALFFYQRIFCDNGRKGTFKVLVTVSICAVVLWTIAFDLLSGLQCGTHFSALWTGAAAYEKYCAKTSYPFLLGYTISDFLLDVWTICLPIPKIWSLHASVARRVSVMGVFLLALVSLASNIARLVVFVQIENTETGSPDAAAGIDVQLVDTKAQFLIILEVGTACIAVNLPSLWFLVGQITPEAVLRSVRSVVSLVSLRSNGSSKDPTSKGGIYGRSGKTDSVPSASESRLAPGEATETHVMCDLESFKAEQPTKNVRVIKTVSQNSQHI